MHDPIPNTHIPASLPSPLSKESLTFASSVSKFVVLQNGDNKDTGSM